MTHARLFAALALASCGPVVTDVDQSESTSGGGDSTSTSSATTSPSDTGTTTAGTSASPSTSSSEVDTGDEVGEVAGDDIAEPDTLPVECDLWKEDCAPGLKCMPWADDGGDLWNALRCSPIDRDADPINAPCQAYYASGTSGFDSCELHTMCWDVDPDTLIGTCRGFCTGTPLEADCADPQAECIQSAEGVFALCLPSCNPLVSSCDRGDLCVADSDGFFCVPDASGDAGALGDLCEYVNGCDPGLFCANAASLPNCDASGCCAAFCDLDSGVPCEGWESGIECVPWYEAGQAPAGYENLGACVVPG